MAFKERTKDQLDEGVAMQKSQFEAQIRLAIESPAKEAMYALDDTNPLRLYDCLVPEMEVHRQLGRVVTDERAQANHIAKLKLKKTEFKIVSQSC